jgi:hypothetical protein
MSKSEHGNFWHVDMHHKLETLDFKHKEVYMISQWKHRYSLMDVQDVGVICAFGII